MVAVASTPADPALQKLYNVLGRQRADELVQEVFRSAGIRGLATPTDRLRFANALMKRGGLLEAIGRAIKIQAILLGAIDD